MLVGGIMSLALILAGIFAVPLVPIEGSSITNYNNLMDATLETVEVTDVDGTMVETAKLTAYDAMAYSIKGLLRGNVSHY